MESFCGLRVAIIGPLPPPSGGMANQTRQLARLLTDEGASVEVVQVNPPYRPGWIADLKGIRAVVRLLMYIPRLWIAAGKSDLFHIMANSGWSWHLFVAPAVWIASLRNTPVILNYRGGEADSFFNTSFRWVKPTLSRASIITVPSGFLQAVFNKWGFSSQIVPNIINLSLFSAHEQAVSQVFTPKANPHLVVTRNLEPIYDVATAIRAFHRVKRSIPAARLSVAGSGPQKASLEALTDALGIEASVVFTGRLDNEQMADLYRKADLMLNSSLVDNMPISILEALASGVPVVSSDVGGIPYLVEDGKTALLVPPGDEVKMAQAALTLLTDAVVHQQMVSQGVEHIRQFSWDNVKSKLLDAYSAGLNQQ